MENVLFGGGLALAAALQPGPLQAFLISRVVARGWRHTLPACMAPLLSDGPIALVAIVVVGRLPLAAQQGLRAAGGVLLLYLAWRAFREWRAPASLPQVSTPRTLVEAVLVNLLNPNPYLAWALILGPAVVAAWRHDPGHAFALVASFYVTMVLTLGLFVFLVGGVRLLGPRRQQALVGVSAALLALLGVLLLAASIGESWAGPTAG
jgi:threonine/homoserine/homoserine lactone efflux protein